MIRSIQCYNLFKSFKDVKLNMCCFFFFNKDLLNERLLAKSIASIFLCIEEQISMLYNMILLLLSHFDIYLGKLKMLAKPK